MAPSVNKLRQLLIVTGQLVIVGPAGARNTGADGRDTVTVVPFDWNHGYINRMKPFTRMTAKTLRKKRGIDCTSGVSREHRAINRPESYQLSSRLLNWLSVPINISEDYSGDKRRVIHTIKMVRQYNVAQELYCDFEANISASAVQRFGEAFCDREVSNTVAFEERPFGDVIKPGEITFPISSNYAVDLSSLVVSLALFDGDKMLFVCSGIPLPQGRKRAIQSLTRFVTSAHLVTKFNENRNKDDKLRVAVRLLDDTITDGFLGLYDKDIAIVTCLGFLGVRPIDQDLKAISIPGGSVQAVGRAFNSSSLMTIHGSEYDKERRRIHPSHLKTWVSRSQHISKAVLGGPLLGQNNKILGMNLDIYDVSGDPTLRCTFLPMDLLFKRLKHFQILNPTKLHFCGYTLPKDVFSVVPSGFMEIICRLKAWGYPIPPPLVLELNGRLLDDFEECFGESLPWKGFPYGDPPGGSSRRVWNQLPKQVVTNLSRCVVSLASFNGYVRYFACTGMLMKWPESTAKKTVILTSASLVRSRDNEDSIDNSLAIEVFLPPNQRAGGTLEFYNLEYNIAIVSLKKNFNAICPGDIKSAQNSSRSSQNSSKSAQNSSRSSQNSSKSAQNSSEKVIAIGRDAKFGVLMAASGEVKCKFYCKDVKLSTCKIKKAGIGGPLINLDGSFVGMNFYNGSDVTPFVPRHKIVEILECGYKSYNHPMPVNVGRTKNGIQKNRWRVPEPYWYHGALDVDIDGHKHIGRRL